MYGSREDIHTIFEHLKRYCEQEHFAGWDPYDGLNSRLFARSGLRKNWLARLIWIQFFKNSPVNLRPLLGIEKAYNPKALALFLSGYCALQKSQPQEKHLENIRFLLNALLERQTKGYSGVCWGYHFDWQSRAFFVPAGTPNVIVSTFGGNALLDAYEVTRQKELLHHARSICDFILNDLHRSWKQRTFCFSYTPLDTSRIINASLLASRFLSRVYAYTQEPLLKDEAGRSVSFCVEQQQPDGGWFYGLDDNQRWIDSFHTAYNLEALYEYQRYTGDTVYEADFKKGMEYYLDHFFGQDGKPFLYADTAYPVDIHSPAMLCVLLAKAPTDDSGRQLLEQVLQWTFDTMYNPAGYFAYQKKRWYTISIPYIRWSCAWMFYALALHSVKEVPRSGSS